MKKIGILTFHWADNYGAVLQAYGLYQYLCSNNFDVEIIDFIPKKLLEPYKIFFNPLKIVKNLGFFNGIKTIIMNIINFPINVRKKIRFNNFRKYMKTSEVILKSKDSFTKYIRKYEYVIVGSDQVWNPDFYTNYEDVYFLNYTSKNTKKISYSASCAITLNRQQIEFIESKISLFDYISIRESSTISQLSILNRITHTIDPVFLIDKTEWDKIYPKRSNFIKYIFVYDLIFDKKIFDFVNEISIKENLSVISYSGSKKYINHLKSIKDGGPIQFIDAIANAEIIVSSSFHGVAFSIIYRKQFFVFSHPNRGIRVKDLLETLGIYGREISDYDSHKFIDYNIVESKIDDFKNISKRFLNSALEVSNEN